MSVAENALTDRLPCGCCFGAAVVDGVQAFVIKPCKMTCRYYRYVIAQANNRDVPIEEHLIDGVQN